MRESDYTFQVAMSTDFNELNISVIANNYL